MRVGNPLGGPLTYLWTQIGGPPAVIEDKNAAVTRITAPKGPTTLTFRLTVTNASGAHGTDSVVVTVKAPK